MMLRNLDLLLFITRENGNLGDGDAILVNLTGSANCTHADGIAIRATPDVVFTKSQDNPDDICKVLSV